MTSPPTSSPGEIPLPDGFLTLDQIRNIPNSSLREKNSFVNVIGFVKDFQPPYKTGGTDFKCSIEIMDYSDRGMKVNFFEKTEQNMPPPPGAGDVVLMRGVKPQLYHGVMGLLKNSSSEFRFLASENIPKKVLGESNPPWRSYPLGKGRSPTAAEMKYVLWASNHADEIDLPSNQEFGVKVVQAMKQNTDKFSLLKDVKPDRYYNILGQVVRLYDSSGTLQVYLSDYTPNSRFHHYAWGEGGKNDVGREGDNFGYISTKNKEAKEWPGPYGKMTIQLTLWDSHASFAREEVKVDDWVNLKNVHVKFGKIGGVLEGFMHEDYGKTNVSIMNLTEGSVEDHGRLKEATNRKLRWWTRFTEQKSKYLEEAAGLGNKRKHDGEGPSKSNSKKRREGERAAKLKRGAAAEAKKMERLNLNENIRCNNPDQPIVALSEILKPQALTRNEEGQQTPSSFTCAKYRAIVRVVDFFPHKIEDFAVGRRPSEYDILSDYSGGEDTDREEDLRDFKSGRGFAKNIWEWRFALQVEDASSKESKERLWLMVDNHAAQGLLNLEDDATNLRGDPKLLSLVREQLFKLWGDLEELKSERLRQQSKRGKELPPSSLGSEFPASSHPRKPGEMPDADSDVENGPSQPKSAKKSSQSAVLTERGPNIPKPGIVAGSADKSAPSLEVKNKVFTCCIRQYGVKVDEDDPSKANAGDGKRWQRAFGLFGTHIV